MKVDSLVAISLTCNVRVVIKDCHLKEGEIYNQMYSKSSNYAHWLHGYYACLQIERSGLSPGRGHCVVFFGKTLYSHSASLYPGVQMGASEFNAGINPVMDPTSHRNREQKYSQSIHATETRDKRRSDEPLGSCAEFTFLYLCIPKLTHSKHISSISCRVQ